MPQQPSGLRREELVTAAREAFALGESLGWRSYDPYDILLSPFARRLPDISPFASRVALQIGRRAGVRLRRLLRVPRHEEPKAVADFLHAAASLVRAGEEWPRSSLEGLSARLRARAVSAAAGCGWGIEFPWVSRYGAMMAGEPNIYTTTVACHALLDDHEVEGREASLDAALAGVRFIRRDLGSFEYDGLPWLRYTASSASPIVNIQASSASLFARVGEKLADAELLDAADSAAGVAVAVQRPDGSWPYSDDGRGEFVDGFHTGFTLQGLIEYVSRRGEGSLSGAADAIDRGFSYFKQHLLSADGRPLGFADGSESLDGQTLAQAIQTLVVCGDPDEARRAHQIWLLTREEERKRSLSALRWSTGPFVVATAVLLRAPEGDRVGRRAG